MNGSLWDGDDEVSAKEERRSSCRSPSIVAGACRPPRLPHLLGQPRAYHVEAPREGLDRQDRPSHARPRSSLHQVTSMALFFSFFFLNIVSVLKGKY